MGWNGSGGKDSAVPRATSSRAAAGNGVKRRVTVSVIIAIAVVSVALFFFMDGRSTGESEQEGRNGKWIADAKPAAVSVKSKKPSEEQTALKTAPRIDWRNADTNSAFYKAYHDKGPAITNSFAMKMQSLSARTFKCSSDKVIGQLLSVKPGAFLFGDVKYDERFTRSFLKSLEKPIVIEPNDSDQVKVLKEEVIEARKELKAAYDRGEDIAKIMTDTRKELKELGAYRAELQKQVNDIVRKDGKKFSEQDLNDCLGAANKMLEDRGCQPLIMPAMMRHRLKVLHSQGIQRIEE